MSNSITLPTGHTLRNGQAVLSCLNCGNPIDLEKGLICAENLMKNLKMIGSIESYNLEHKLNIQPVYQPTEWFITKQPQPFITPEEMLQLCAISDSKYTRDVEEFITERVIPFIKESVAYLERQRNALINIQATDFSGQQVNAVSARDLHKFLGSKRKFTDWVQSYVHPDNDYGFIQGIDFIRTHAGVNPTNGIKLDDYAFTIEMAKEVSMLSKTEKGKEARKYFIECERKVLNHQLEAKTPEPEKVAAKKPLNAAAIKIAISAIEKMPISEGRKALVIAQILDQEYGISKDLLLPEVPHMLSATQIADKIGTSANAVGRAANSLGLKDNPELCQARLSTAPNGGKEVEQYHYSPKVIPMIEDYLKQKGNKLGKGKKSSGNQPNLC